MKRLLGVVAVLFGLLLVVPLSASGSDGNLYLMQAPSAPGKLVWTNTAGEWRSDISSYGDTGAESMLVDVNSNVLAGNGQFRLNVRSGDDENTTFDIQKGVDSEGYAALSGSMFKGLTLGGTHSPAISDGVGIDVNGKLLRLRQSKTPNGAGDVCKQGEIGWNADYLFVCVAENQWKRSRLRSW